MAAVERWNSSTAEVGAILADPSDSVSGPRMASPAAGEKLREFSLEFRLATRNNHGKWINEWMHRVNQKNTNGYLRGGLRKNARRDSGPKLNGRND